MKSNMTKKEEEVMEMLWKHGPMSVSQLLEKYPDPKPHFNTVSTMVRSLEKKGYVDHKAEGVSYHYFAKVSEAEYGKGFIKNIIHRYMDNSYMSAVSMFVEEEKISVEELKKMIADIEKSGTNTSKSTHGKQNKLLTPKAPGTNL